MAEQEKYLGVVWGAPLKKGILPGYALYATTSRIIGVKERRDDFLYQVGPRGRHGNTLRRYEREDEKRESELDAEMKNGFTGEPMRKLLESKDLEVKKDEIKAIQLKRTGSFRSGHIKFQLKSGKEIEIEILSEANNIPGFFEKVGGLLQTFFPEGVQIED